MKTILLLGILIAAVQLHAQSALDDARSAYERSEYPTVIRLTTPLLKSNPKDRTALLLRGLARMEMKDPKACEDGDKLLKLDSTMLDAYLFVAECRQRTGDIKGSIAVLDRAGRRWPDSSQIPYAKAIAFTRAQRWEEAIPHLESTVARRPDNTKAAFLLAQCYARTDHAEDAASLYGRIIDAEPGEIFARWALADLMMQQNKVDSALSLYKEILALNPSVIGVYKPYATALHMKGRQAEAIKVLEDLVKQTPTDPEAWYNLGVAQQALKKDNDAIRSYRKAIEIKPNFAEAYFNLGMSQVETGFTEEGINSFKRASVLNAKLAPSAYNSIAVIYRISSRFDESIAASKEAISLADSIGEYRATMAYTYLAADKYDEAVRYAEPLREQFPDNPDILLVLGKCYLRVGRKPEAEQIAAQLDKLHPPFAHDLRDMMK
jgi:tetratricopeptide (TPR) repeat protein